MSLVGGLIRSVVNPATIGQLLMGPAGWASLAIRTIGAAVGQQLIQQLGQRLGLPQGVINFAQNAFAAASGTQGMPQTIAGAVGQLAQQFNLSPAQQGALERSARNDLNSMLQDLVGSDEFKSAKSGGGKGFLEKIAVALGQALDRKMNKAASLADQIGRQGDSSQSKLGELNGKMAATSQEISILSNALNNTIKTIGEAEATIARKG